LADAAPIKTFFTQLFDIHTDERAWRVGADNAFSSNGLGEKLRRLNCRVF
jgi:hypothetical protein